SLKTASSALLSLLPSPVGTRTFVSSVRSFVKRWSSSSHPKNGAEAPSHLSHVRLISARVRSRPIRFCTAAKSRASLKLFFWGMSSARVHALRIAKPVSSFSSSPFSPCPSDTGDTETQETQGDARDLGDLGGSGNLSMIVTPVRFPERKSSLYVPRTSKRRRRFICSCTPRECT